MTTFKFRGEFRARQGINTESNLTTDLVANALLVKCTFIGHANYRTGVKFCSLKTIQMMKSTERAQGGPTGHVDFI